ncbi:MAG: hypothetical protein U9O82_01435 [Thermodesulfobacteriota bacterium]|nr:hypothetical protein [Thermodesulfobacteriota bacterium]
MNYDTTLFLPDTVLNKNTVKKLLLFFESVYHYLPTEAETGTEDETFSNELIRGYAPVPLGDDLLRFRKMMKDLTGHGDEYYGGYLSSLSHDLLIDRDEASVWALISNISGTDGRTAKSTSAAESIEELWRARLLLKLAESLDHADQETNNGLARIEFRQTVLMKSLRGEDGFSEKTMLEDAANLHNEIPEAVSFNIKDILAPSHFPIRAEYLIKAWGRLYIADRNIEERPFILTTGLINAEHLFDALEYHFKKEPAKLFSIILPDFAQAEDVEYLNVRNSFRLIAGDCIKNMTQLLLEIIQGKQTVRLQPRVFNAVFPVMDTQEGGDAHPLFEKKVAAWTEAVKSFEQSSAGRHRLSFYLFPEISFHELFEKISGSVETDTFSSSRPHHSIMAVIGNDE